MEPIFPAEESSMQQQMQEMSFSFDPQEATLETEPAAADSEESSTESVVFARLESDVNSVAFSPHGRKIVAGLGNGTLQLFDAISGKPIGAPFRGHNYNVWSVAFSPTSPAFPEEISEVIASGGEDKTLRLWDLQGNQIGEPFQGHEFGVLSVAFSPDSKVLVSGSGDQTLRLWDLQGNQIGLPFQGHEDWVRSVAFSPDGSLIVSGSDDQTLRLWDLQGNQIGLPFQGHESRVWSVAFSPDGKFIVSGSDDQTVRLWDLQGNQIGSPFQGHESWVLSVAFSPDGRFIVSGSADQTLRFWDLQGNQIRLPFQGHGSYVWSVAFSPDGKAIVSGSSDRTLRLWDLQGNSIANRRQIIEVPQGITNDAAEGEDRLNIRDEIEAMATVLMLRSLQPPVAVAILGSWGSGKSFGMHLMRQKIKEIREQKLTNLEAWGDPDLPNNTEILSPYVGHVYQISFNAWTYAKSDLWASLMQEIFYELNRQITLERQIGTFLSASSAPEENKIEQPEFNSAKEVSSIRNIDRLIYTPFQNLKETIQKNIKTRTISLKKKLTIFAQEILNLWLVQLVLHIVIFLITILENIFYYLFVVPLDRITKERFDLISKFNTILFVYFIREQFEAYYFPPDLQTSYKSWRKGIESVIEHLLFLFFVGFPKRLKDSKDNLDNFKERQNPKPVFTAEPDIEAIRQEEFAKTLLDGGDFWEVLYLSSDEERRAFIEKNNRLRKFKDWKDPTSNSNYLWNTLDQNKQNEQQVLKEQEKKLQAKEQELQRKLKAAEAEVNRQIANRKATALYQPIVKAIARLLLSKEDIEKLAEADKTTDETLGLIKKVVTSWQGLTALFVMTFVIVLSLDSVTRAAIFAAIQNLLEQTGLTALIDRLIPITVKNNLTAFANLIRDWLTNLPQWFEWIRTQIPSAAQIITGVVAVGASLIPILKTLNNYLTSVQKEQAKIQSDREFLLKQKQDKAENLVKEVAQLKLQVAEQRQRVGLTANYASLMDFVSDRLQVDDYGKRLGLMQQVKQDLADLSDRLTDWQHNRDELKKFFPRGPARVVLYIDDLDRCPPNRVVEVLESVQLLLNTKLFIVVLGIDDRYIARALEQVYEGVLKRGGKPSGLDYLEKIIQIPYRMRPIASSEIRSYLGSQTQITKSESKKPAALTSTAISQGEITPEVKSDDSIILESTQVAAEDSSSVVEMESPLDISPAPPVTTTTDSPSYLESIAQTIEFKEPEFNLLVECCKHVDITPRTAKRLINIYKILQIIWSTRNSNGNLPTDQDKRIVMSFLALSGRYPTYMRNLFEEIDVLFEETVEQGKPLEIYLGKLLKMIKPTVTEDDRYASREWRKFTSDITRMLEPDEPPQKLKIHREVFHLMLSFCFVGDIGYDPRDVESKL